MILHILLKTTFLLFVTSSQAQIGAFKCSSQLNESPFFKSFNRKPSGFDWRLNEIGDTRDVTALKQTS